MFLDSKSRISKVLSSVFGSRNSRLLKQTQKKISTINALEENLFELSDEDLKEKTNEFRARFSSGETLDQLLPEAFSVARETSRRVLGMRHFDAQLVGGIVLHEGKIAEMRTGEGKTLAATLPAYLNALSGKSVHVVTVNDYLATRDAGWMGVLYNALGLSVGVIVSGMEHEKRKEAYCTDVTYGTNNEFGFDYLRDNMCFSSDQQVQRDLAFAIIDEVDSILIDEARTPLIISGPADDKTDLYIKMNALVAPLKRQLEDDDEGDYSLDEKTRQVYLTEKGHINIEGILLKADLLLENDSLYSAANISLIHHVYAAIRAHNLFQKDVDYVVQEGEIVIVDEFTGRTMPGRRWSEGLHQAVEAKEGLSIKEENQTLASITYQNYFRLYQNLSGMTGTADTEAYEFQEIYGLEVVVIPTNKNMVREDNGDLVYLTTREKFLAIVEDVEDCVKRQQPVLVGTTSIETSEYLSSLLTERDIKHKVLNAKFHEQEARIIADAGMPASVTVATNMAGRGTDIILGGNPDFQRDPIGDVDLESSDKWKSNHEIVICSGGLHIIGTERHESRRIDNQLRGRSGRQGDPGSSRFYLSLEDNLMRIFASEKVAGLMQKLGMKDGEAIEHPWVSKAIENAQRKVEGRNFDIRKQLLDFDDVANDQRKNVYEQRREMIESVDIERTIIQIREDVVGEILERNMSLFSGDAGWNLTALSRDLEKDLGIVIDFSDFDDNSVTQAALEDVVFRRVDEEYRKKELLVGSDALRNFEKSIMLQVLDTQWKEHLAAMDYLRKGIHLRGFAQKNPKQEYKREAFEMFSQMLDDIQRSVVGLLLRVQVSNESDLQRAERKELELSEANYHHGGSAPDSVVMNPTEVAGSSKPFKRGGEKVGRNEPCPCGSGKKFKQCHGRTP
ncbi:MAG: preprotein translocase subunit SecA [Proteobacteria bacterium]|jgi:preprotein translocase subunit SecA|nr:preprotein translocase subunit SecA [Pseudomonadota bacterium]MBT5064735.1 preprotein translocase subunit SecA [Pseudomonadota bacterium]MBT6194149.1 preprotein translocase subunit SecA [Pseudomonadota bacterium]MBT6465374.1 preprotein translocase subunit SecA [Pseudomonadota bacterium]MBT7245948.1 preprotein translocase subunit SecA [Pseudomonadota bacterium]